MPPGSATSVTCYLALIRASLDSKHGLEPGQIKGKPRWTTGFFGYPRSATFSSFSLCDHRQPQSYMKMSDDKHSTDKVSVHDEKAVATTQHIDLARNVQAKYVGG